MVTRMASVRQRFSAIQGVSATSAEGQGTFKFYAEVRFEEQRLFVERTTQAGRGAPWPWTSASQLRTQ